MLLPLQLQQLHGGIKFLERSSHAVGHIRQKLAEYHGALRADLPKQTKGCRLMTGPGIGVVSDVLPMLTVEGAHGMPIARESGSFALLRSWGRKSIAGGSGFARACRGIESRPGQKKSCRRGFCLSRCWK